MDEIDKEIIQLIETNGRMTHEEISRLLHISRPSVHQRVSKMEQKGIIKGYRSIIDWSKMDEKIKAIILVKIKCNNFKKTASDIISLPIPGVTILEAQRLAGEWCMMLKVRVSDSQKITDLIDEMVKIPEVQETSTILILTTILENSIIEQGYTDNSNLNCFMDCEGGAFI